MLKPLVVENELSNFKLGKELKQLTSYFNFPIEIS